VSGKGSTRRPKQISDDELAARWAMAFGGPIEVTSDNFGDVLIAALQEAVNRTCSCGPDLSVVCAHCVVEKGIAKLRPVSEPDEDGWPCPCGMVADPESGCPHVWEWQPWSQHAPDVLMRDEIPPYWPTDP
jgi:hypothetical protein